MSPVTPKDEPKVAAPATSRPELSVAAPVTFRLELSVVSPVTSRVPPTAVFPELAVTLNLLVAISKSPSMPVAPITSNVPAIAVLPVTSVTTNLSVSIVKPPSNAVAALKVCAAVQVLALPKSKEATTSPVVGKIVNVPSLLETETTLAVPPAIEAI